MNGGVLIFRSIGLGLVALALAACGDGTIGGTARDEQGGPGATQSLPPGGALPQESTEPAPQPAPGVTETFSATRTTCMRPCAVQLDAQKGASLTWPEVRDSEYIWDFDDGGSRTDSEGFLAAAVYETAGTHRLTVTVDGETWNPETITVLDPTRTVCVGTDFSDCPSAASGDHFATISSAVTATRSEAGRHILLERGGSYGALPNGNATPTMIGAYGSGAKPKVTAADVDLTTDWSFVDLAINGGGGGVAIEPRSNGGLLLRITGTGGANYQWIYTSKGAFIIDSSIVTGAPYPLLIGDNTPWFVVKNSTLNRTASGQHTIRIDGPSQERILIQNSQILGNSNQTSLTIRGNTRWLLVQGNLFNQSTGTGESEPGDSRLQEKIVFERNAYDRQNGNTGIDWGFNFEGIDMIVRNNVVYNNGGQFDYAAANGGAGATKNIWFINNTSIGNDTSGFQCGNTIGCVLKNNLVYSTSSPWGDCLAGTSGATVSKNWCYTDDECLDPVTGASGCYNSNFVSLTYGHADFARPAPATRGIDAGGQTVPVWNDFDNSHRTTIDVGAVER